MGRELEGSQIKSQNNLVKPINDIVTLSLAVCNYPMPEKECRLETPQKSQKFLECTYNDWAGFLDFQWEIIIIKMLLIPVFSTQVFKILVCS